MSLRDWRVKPALLAMFTGWAALFSWSGMVAQPLGFLLLVVAIGLVLALGGSLLRLLPLPWYAVAGAQALVIMLALNLIYASEESALGLVPTASSVREVVYVLANGGATLNTYAAPVTINPTHTQALLAACGLLVLLAVDVLAEGLRRPTLVALPLLVTLSVPVSILNGALALPVFVVTALLFLRLLAVERIDGWTSGPGTRSEAAPAAAHPGAASMWVASVGAVLLALLLAPAVPVADLLDRHDEGTGDGAGSGYQLTTVNPLIRLRRDLVEQTNTPLVYAETDSTSTGYLRTTVLDLFTGDEWRPSRRILPSDNAADGTFPSPPGLAVDAPGVTADWSLELTPDFSTTWLPLPYPIRTLDVPGGWRFDTRTLDVALVGRASSDGLEYDATSFTPSINARQLDSRTPGADAGAVIDDRCCPTTCPRSSSNAPARSPPARSLTSTRPWPCRTGSAATVASPTPSSQRPRLGHGPARRLRHRRPGRLLRAVRGRHGRDGPVARHPVAGGRRLPGRPGAARRPDPLHQRRPARLAGDVLRRRRLGPLRAHSGPARRRDAGVHPTGRDRPCPHGRRRPASPAPLRGPTGTRPTPTARATTAGRPCPGGRSPPSSWCCSWRSSRSCSAGCSGVDGWPRPRRCTWPRARGRSCGATALDLGLDWPERGSPREQARSVVDQVLQPPAEEVGSLEGLLVQVERGRYARGRERQDHRCPGACPDAGDGRDVAPADDRQRRPRARLAERAGSWRAAAAVAPQVAGWAAAGGAELSSPRGAGAPSAAPSAA